MEKTKIEYNSIIRSILNLHPMNIKGTVFVFCVAHSPVMVVTEGKKDFLAYGVYVVNMNLQDPVALLKYVKVTDSMRDLLKNIEQTIDSFRRDLIEKMNGKIV